MTELQTKLDTVTTDFGETISNLKMTKEVLSHSSNVCIGPHAYPNYTQELANMKHFSNTAGLELKEKVPSKSHVHRASLHPLLPLPLPFQNVALQVQVHSLFDDIAAAEEKKHQFSQKLSQTKKMLEASKEEEQILKVTLSEKDAQLLQTSDQIL